MKLALRLILCFFIAFSTASAAFAAPSIRDQAIGISKELRDPGAVNQSLYESNAPQAAELKTAKREKTFWITLPPATESKSDTIRRSIPGPLRFGWFPPHFFPDCC